MTAGRPLDYTEEDFASTVSEYFSGVKETEVPTKAGLLLALDISRETWRTYKQRPEFLDTIKRAEFLIENAWNQKLIGGGATGPIFYLKNAFKEEYRDSHDVTSGGKELPAPIIPLNVISRDDSDKEDNGAKEEN